MNDTATPFLFAVLYVCRHSLLNQVFLLYCIVNFSDQWLWAVEALNIHNRIIKTGERAYLSNFVCVCVCVYFQGKKDVCQIFNNILRRQIGTRSPTVEYFGSHQEVLFILLKGWDTHTHTHTHTHRYLYTMYTFQWLPKRWHERSISVWRYETPQVALNCGIMLRECIRHEPLARIVLHSDHFHSFFNYVEMSTFDIASDAFATFKVLQISMFSPVDKSVYTRSYRKYERTCDWCVICHEIFYIYNLGELALFKMD